MTHIPDEAVQAALDATNGNIPPVMLESALTAALPHLPLGYEVKKLEWKLRANGGFTCIDDNEYCIDFWENEQLYVGSYTTMERSKNADDVKEALQKKFERRVRECVVAKPVDVAAVRRQAFEEIISFIDVFERDFDQKWRDQLKSEIRALSAEPAQVK